jgi:uncharacterized RDD family membrane protein YckC
MDNTNIPQPVISPQPSNQDPTVAANPVVQPVSQSGGVSRPNYNVMDRRVSAFLLDVVLWIPIFIIASQHFGTYHVSGGMINFNLTGIPFVIFALLFTAYYVLFEGLVGGTLGKLAVGIRVVDEHGNKLSIGKSLIRNLLRIVDGFPYIIPNLVGFIVASTSDKKQRLGDKVAHTLVVKTDNTKSASKKAWLSLAALVILGVVIIIVVPASKKATGSTNSNSTNSSVNSTQSSAAQTVSDQVFNDVINGNTQAIYQLASPALKQAQTESQLATGIQQIDQLITGTPQPSSQASYPASNEAQFVYSVQTTQGTKSLVIDLGLVNGQWLLYSAQIQ